MDAHTDARYHTHGQFRLDDAGKPGALKGARRVWRGPVGKRSSNVTFVGWLPYHDRDEMEVLFTFLSERYERKSVLITTNLIFSEWERISKDPMTTMAVIDRVVHHCVILDMMSVASYRAQQANHQHVPEAGNPKTAEVISH